MTVLDQQQKQNAHKNQFLFSLGSPKPRIVPGVILVAETPEHMMCKRNMLDKRL